MSEYCEDCGIHYTRHGEDCGYELGDVNAPSYGRPAGWVDGRGRFTPMGAPAPVPACPAGHGRMPVVDVRMMPVKFRGAPSGESPVWVYRCPVEACGREGVAVRGFPHPRFALLVPTGEDDTEMAGRSATPEERAALIGDVLA